MAETEAQKESKARDSIQQSASKESVYRPFGNSKDREQLFQLVANKSGVDLFDSIVSFFDSTIEKERSTVAEQVISDLGRIEYYVNNAGWDTEKRRGREISLIWGLRAKYSNVVGEED